MKTQFEASGMPITPEEAAHAATSGIHAETMLAGFDVIESYIYEGLLSGRHYKGRYITLIPRVRGVILAGQSLNEVEHKLGFNILFSEKLREMLKSVKLVLKGHKEFEDFAKILSVEDVETGRRDGFVTAGDDIYITGEKIKVVGKEEEGGLQEAGIGVFFVPLDGGAILPAKRINRNEPTWVSVRTPANLSVGTEYRLRIVTRFTHGSVLVNRRTVEFRTKLFTSAPS
jgi:hypothetical protein